MSDLQSRWDIHVELEDLNAETAIIKKIFEEVEVYVYGDVYGDIQKAPG